MARSLAVVVFLVFAFSARPCFAAGGTCPSAGTYHGAASKGLGTLASFGVTNCYFVAANGSDSNSGTSEATPWLHAPGMPNCAARCAGVTPVAGNGFILRGGDTWHFGDSLKSPYVGPLQTSAACNGVGACAWNMTWIGKKGSPIYWGVDHAWFNAAVCGASWCRPIMDGDNPPSTVGLAACSFDESAYNGFINAKQDFTILDNFEFTGACWSGPQGNRWGPNCCLYYVMATTSAEDSGRVFENLYFHGWSHVKFNCKIQKDAVTGNCQGLQMIEGVSDSSMGLTDEFVGIVCDGSDTDRISGGCIFVGAADIHNSVFRYVSNGVVINNMHVFHDNLLEYIVGGADGVAHANGIEFNNEAKSVNAVYNNVIRHLWKTGITCGEVTAWQTPMITDYTFNNLVYDIPCDANYWDNPNGLHGVSGWTLYFFNNTFVQNGDGPSAMRSIPLATVISYNNHCITPRGGSAQSCASDSLGGKLIQKNNVVQSTSKARAQGYTSSSAFAYSPSSASSATVGAGANVQSLCAALAAAGLADASAACQSDTGYACNYDAASHSISCPARRQVARPAGGAWDAGVYQFQAAPSSPAKRDKRNP